MATIFGQKNCWCKLIWYLVSRWGLGPKVCMHHFGCGMNWIKVYYMIVKVKNATFWFSTYSMEMHSLTSSSVIICLWGETFGSRTILYLQFSIIFYCIIRVPNFGIITCCTFYAHNGWCYIHAQLPEREDGKISQMFLENCQFLSFFMKSNTSTTFFYFGILKYA